MFIIATATPSETGVYLDDSQPFASILCRPKMSSAGRGSASVAVLLLCFGVEIWYNSRLGRGGLQKKDATA